MNIAKRIRPKFDLSLTLSCKFRIRKLKMVIISPQIDWMMKYSTKITKIKVILKNNVVASSLDFLWYTVHITIKIIKV